MKFLLVTDLDHTLVGDDEATLKLNNRLQAKREQLCLVYATGRSYASTQQLMIEKNLLTPNYLITGVGTEIYEAGILDPNWAELLSHNWDRDLIATVTQEFPLLKPQSPQEQNPWKLSFIVERASVAPPVLDALKKELEQTGLATQIVYSSSRDVDIIPQRSNKGNAIAFLKQRLQIQSQDTIVCGDSGNDIGMFEQDVCGVIVGNAQAELLDWYRHSGRRNHYLARSAYAWGILEGIEFFWRL